MISASPTDVPFHATIFFTEHVTVIGSPYLLAGTISGKGVATKLGAVTFTSTDCINQLSPTLYEFASSEAVLLTAKNGDQLWATYHGYLSEGVITGTYTIYDGTGRTANATGSGTLQGFEAIDPVTLVGIGVIQLQGTLSH